MRPLIAALLLLGTTTMADADETILHFSAGSLRAPLTELAKTFTARTGVKIEQTFQASGTIRGKIAAGTPADVFTSANMNHPQELAKAGKLGPTVLFARNELCAFAMPKAGATADTLLDRMLDPAVKLGTSTPKADPAGDYAFEVFARAEALKPGARAALEAKALKLTGGPTSPQPPAGKNVYAMQLASGAADIMLAYCTNTGPIARELPEAQALHFRAPLVVRADYGLGVAPGASAAAHAFALFILSEEGQKVLAAHGFAAPTLPTP